MVAHDVDVDRTDAVHPVFIDLVKNVHHAGLFDEPGHRIHLGEHAAQLAVFLPDLFHIGIDLSGRVELPFLDRLVFAEVVFGNDFGPHHFDVPDLVPRAFIDVVDDRQLRFIFVELQIMLDAHIEIPQAMVVLLHLGLIVGNRGGIIFAADDPELAGLGLQLELEERIGEKVVPLELHPGDDHLGAFVDQKHHFAIIAAVALLQFDSGEREALLVIHLLDAAGALAVGAYVIRAAIFRLVSDSSLACLIFFVPRYSTRRTIGRSSTR